MRLLRLAGPIIEQGLWTSAAFAANTVIARNSQPEEFGRVSLIVAVAMVAVGATRSSMGATFLSGLADEGHDDWGSDDTDAYVSAAIVVAAALLVITVIAAAVFGSARWTYFASGALAAALVVTDALRMKRHRLGRPRGALALVLTWSILSLAFLAGADVINATADIVVACWALASSIFVAAALTTSILGGSQRIIVYEGVAWIRRGGRHLGRLASEFLVLSLTFNAFGVLALPFVGLASVAALRGGQVLVGPVNIALSGLALASTVSIGAAHRSRLPYPRRDAVVTSLLAAGVVAAWGAVLVVLPAAAGRAVLGDTWDSAQLLLLPLTWLFVANACQLGAIVTLRATGSTSAILRTRIAMAAAVVGAGLAGTAARGIVIGVTCMSVAETVGILVWWKVAMRAAGVQRGTLEAR